MAASLSSSPNRREPPPASTSPVATPVVSIRLDRPFGPRAAASGIVFLARLHVGEAEAALDAQVPARHGMVGRARHLHDLVVLHVQLELAADPAVGADRVRDRLLLLVP